jgi:hypothetical protein
MTAIPHGDRNVVGAGSPAVVYAHSGPLYQAYRILQVAFVAAPIIAGLDKFFDRLADWDMYVSPFASRMLGGHVHGFMMLAGMIEIVAGILVALKPRYFAYVVAAWLVLIIINLLMSGGFYDIALRDLGLALAAVALGRLASLFDTGMLGGLKKTVTTP